MELKTPLYDCHVACGGKIVPFAGYLLPVQYQTGIIAEHNAVRNAAGLFDVSHMGEIMFRGDDALQCLNYLLTNDFSTLDDGHIRYSVMCNPQGGCLDDVLVYRFSHNEYMVVVNASNRHSDYEWMKSNLIGAVSIEDISDTVAQIALQGPAAHEILTKIFTPQLPSKYYTFTRISEPFDCLVSQTGYTGSGGYEIYLPTSQAPTMWNILLEAGKEFGLIPCGLGARDTLRLEAAMPLYGHEMDETVSPLETGLDFGVKMNKTDFIGKQALLNMGAPRRHRIGLKITGHGIAREHQDVYLGERLIGHTTSGTHAPYLKYPIAMALVATDAVGSHVTIDVRGRRIEAEVVALPFYKKS
ncbi:MAG: glycine cleavage system aminomethyltransferase GcvT [Tannerella sp.]|jgi:aminomethyltransferase|nr:glycine cleavage system aminomethyltransferase GcvT [Tannerella sp.]